ncbi:hypothetical protein [Alkalihalobacillus sp. AL-G]|uniref:hypothetical protein n=1 Tax=Alkalihalobacillus sp. AL-G TaxID=2926399 RepID=UPI00272BB91B|nr:hypothetical protein [Alkalihalobacillus sp. AL-G]WLD94504.1 hypothetical protein MOJ78_06350 [Alkalihalobacillus sp. AL-G]
MSVTKAVPALYELCLILCMWHFKTGILISTDREAFVIREHSLLIQNRLIAGGSL